VKPKTLRIDQFLKLSPGEGGRGHKINRGWKCFWEDVKTVDIVRNFGEGVSGAEVDRGGKRFLVKEMRRKKT